MEREAAARDRQYVGIARWRRAVRLSGSQAIGVPIRFQTGLKLGSFHQRGNGHIERIANAGDVEHADIALAAFDFSHVRPIEPCRIGKGFLRKIALKTHGANGRAQFAQLPIGVGVDRLTGHTFVLPVVH